MTSGNPYTPQALDCPSCGAALPTGQGRVECSYCGTIVQIDPPKPNDSRFQSRPLSDTVSPSAPTITIIRSRNRPTQPKTSGFVSALITIGVVASFALALYAFQRTTGITLLNPATLFQPRLYASQTMAVLTPDLARPQIVMRVNGGEENAYRLALLDLATKERVWVGPALTKEAVSGEMAIADTTIVFSDNRSLIGFSRADGSKLWSAPLSDKVCDGCLVIANGAAVALTADYVVQGIDLNTGKLLWRYTKLGDYVQRRLQVVGNNILAYGRDQDSHGRVTLLDGKTGKLVRQFVPACTDPSDPSRMAYTDPDTPQWLSPDGNLLVVVSDSSPPCIHAYDLTNGQQRWQSTLEPLESGIDLRKSFIASAGELFIGGSSRMYAVNLADGHARTVVTDENYAFLPLTIRDGVVFTVAIKQRGTRLIELWGVDTKNGEPRWRHQFSGDGEMFEPPYDASGTISGDEQVWGWAETPAGFTLVTLSAKPYRYTIATLDAKTGQSVTTKTIDQPDDDTIWVPDQAARQGNLLYLVASAKLLVLDLANGTVAYEGP
jgi:outer membrane protein assembly factor BamB